MKKERIIQKLLNIKLLNINMLKTSDKYTHVWVYSMFLFTSFAFLSFWMSPNKWDLQRDTDSAARLLSLWPKSYREFKMGLKIL